jgi:hypothetical protein
VQKNVTRGKDTSFLPDTFKNLTKIFAKTRCFVAGEPLLFEEAKVKIIRRKIVIMPCGLDISNGLAQVVTGDLPSSMFLTQE